MASQGCVIEELPTARGVGELAAYLELHIEQGPVLEHESADIGIVSAIVGLVGFDVRMSGQANHAGTTPMALRRDALAGAARALCELREVARRTPGMTSNVGTISVEPGGKNVIPGTCDFTIDVRAATAGVFEELEATVRTVLGRVSEEEGLEVELSELYRLEPVELDTGLSDLLEQAAVAVKANCMRMPSGAGHDAMILGRHVASGMIFVPSRAGVSHSPDEYTSPAQCDLGARVLAKALQFIGT
jgi:hydantoinase/carbamoylase family amidase